MSRANKVAKTSVRIDGTWYTLGEISDALVELSKHRRRVAVADRRGIPTGDDMTDETTARGATAARIAATNKAVDASVDAQRALTDYIATCAAEDVRADLLAIIQTPGPDAPDLVPDATRLLRQIVDAHVEHETHRARDVAAWNDGTLDHRRKEELGRQRAMLIGHARAQLLYALAEATAALYPSPTPEHADDE